MKLVPIPLANGNRTMIVGPQGLCIRLRHSAPSHRGRFVSGSFNSQTAVSGFDRSVTSSCGSTHPRRTPTYYETVASVGGVFTDDSIDD